MQSNLPSSTGEVQSNGSKPLNRMVKLKVHNGFIAETAVISRFSAWDTNSGSWNPKDKTLYLMTRLTKSDALSIVG